MNFYYSQSVRLNTRSSPNFLKITNTFFFEKIFMKKKRNKNRIYPKKMIEFFSINIDI